MRFVMYGAGAVGASIGGLLHQAGHPTALIARGRHAEVMAAIGLDLLTPTQRVRLPIPVVTHPSELDLDDEDVVLLAMKSQDTGPALEALAACGFRGAVVCAQNGVDNERQALRRFERVYGLCVQLPGTFLEPGVVACHGSPALAHLDLGCYPGGVDDTAVSMAAALRDAGFESEAEADIMAIKHAKLLGNLANALDAAVGRGAMGSGAAKAARREGRDCFVAAGIACEGQAEYGERVKNVGIVAIEGITQRGSSSWQSLLKGSGSIEADYLNGEIVLLGRLHGVPTPVNAVLQRLANHMAANHEPPHSYTLDHIDQLIAAETSRA
ncbi:MAG: ketopantoate reductase family protein [Acidimicrobiales bacterium]